MGNLIFRQEDDEEVLFYARLAEWWEMKRPPDPEDEEPLDFSGLPQNLVHSIVKKLDYLDYTQLEETSKSVATTLNNGDFSLVHPVETVFINAKTTKITRFYWYYDRMFDIRRIPWHVATGRAARIHADSVDITCRASSGRMKAVAKLFEKNKTRANVLRIMEHVLFEPGDLDRVLKALEVKQLECRQFLPREFFVNPDSGLNKVFGATFHTNGCTDEELVKLKIPFMHMYSDFITNRGLNKFLKQWKKREREITWFCIELGGTFGSRNIDTILEGLDANPIWTPDMHEHSLVGAIKLDDFVLMKTGDPEHLYSLWSVDSPDDLRLISISQDHMEISMINNEASTLLGYLDDDQYYLARKTCRWCEQEFCCHRRRYSTQRFKKFYPRVHAALINGIKAVATVFIAARSVQLLLGATPPPFPLSIYDVKRIHFEEDAGFSFSNNVIYNLRVYFLNQKFGGLVENLESCFNNVILYR